MHARKDYPAPSIIPPVPKFEPLVVDLNNDESRTAKSKTPTAMTGTFSPNFTTSGGLTTKNSNKPSSITPLPRINLPAIHDENTPNSRDTPGTNAASSLGPASFQKKFVIKKRSTTLVSQNIIHEWIRE